MQGDGVVVLNRVARLDLSESVRLDGNSRERKEATVSDVGAGRGPASVQALRGVCEDEAAGWSGVQRGNRAGLCEPSASLTTCSEGRFSPNSLQTNIL